MKVAIAHPWFLETGGAEKVVDVLASMYPGADIVTLSADYRTLSKGLKSKRIITSPLNKLLGCFRSMRASFMILFPWAIERLDVSAYDLVISSCPPVMGVNVSQDAVHICYCHSPQRSWWHLYSKRQAKMNWFKRNVFTTCAVAVRLWEFTAMQRVDHIICNSNYIADRIWKYFRRTSTVIYPPVDTSFGYLSERHGDYYLSVSRLDVDKGIELLIHACNRLQRRLVVVGTGRKEKELRAIAGPSIQFLGRVPDSDLSDLYAKCRAFLFAADEDFGIAPVEAQSFGRPVIAYGHGGSLETVRVNDPSGLPDTGVFFSAQTVESVIDGIGQFELREEEFLPREIQRHSRQFDRSVFIRRFAEFIEGALNPVDKGASLADCH
jgi:glycosyltransferase involved in cell wall biosynthesis